MAKEAVIDMTGLWGEGLCPKCNSARAYKLGDGRLMCKSCRTKYTPAPKNWRLDQATMVALVENFWRMKSIQRTAQEMGLNKKTVQRHFSRIRDRIAQQGAQEAKEALRERAVAAMYVGELKVMGGEVGITDMVSVFGLCLCRGRVHLVFPHELRDWSGLKLPTLHLVVNPSGALPAEGRDALGQCEAFWRFARIKLKHYRGGFKKLLPLYMREMEYRFNYGDNYDPPADLYSLVLRGPKRGVNDHVSPVIHLENSGSELRI